MHKAFGKIQYTFPTKTHSKLGKKGDFLNLISASMKILQLASYLKSTLIISIQHRTGVSGKCYQARKRN